MDYQYIDRQYLVDNYGLPFASDTNTLTDVNLSGKINRASRQVNLISKGQIQRDIDSGKLDLSIVPPTATTDAVKYATAILTEALLLNDGNFNGGSYSQSSGGESYSGNDDGKNWAQALETAGATLANVGYAGTFSIGSVGISRDEILEIDEIPGRDKCLNRDQLYDNLLEGIKVNGGSLEWAEPGVPSKGLRLNTAGTADVDPFIDDTNLRTYESQWGVESPPITKTKLLIIASGQSNSYGYVPASLAVSKGTTANYDTPVQSETYGLDRATKKWVPLELTNQWNQMPTRGAEANDGSKMYQTGTALAHKIKAKGIYDQVRIFGVGRPSGGFGPIVTGKAIGNIGLDQNVLSANGVDPVLQGRTLLKTLAIIADPNSTEFIDLREYDIWIWWHQGESDVYAMKSIPNYGELYQNAVRATIDGFKEILQRSDALVSIGDMTPNWRAEFEADADKAGISSALAQAPSKLSHAGFVNTDDIVNVPFENGTIHYGLKAMGVLAQKHADLYENLVNRTYKSPIAVNAEALIINQDDFKTWPSQNKVSGDWIKNYKVNSPGSPNYSDLTLIRDYVSYRADQTPFYRFRFEGIRTDGSTIQAVWEQNVNPLSLTNDVQQDARVGYKLISFSDSSNLYNATNVPLGALVPAPAGYGSYFLTIDTTKNATCWRFMTTYGATTAGGSLRATGGDPVYTLQSTKLYVMKVGV